MKILVLGSGGREHAIAWAVSRSPKCTELIVSPGNPGMPGRHVLVDITSPAAVCALASETGAELVIVGPETVIASGVTDALRSQGVAVFGPSRAAGEIETSKTWAMDFCTRHSIASPVSRSFGSHELEAALKWAVAAGQPMVVKADGLAAGKGVVVAETVDETCDAIRSALVGGAFGAAGATVLVQERLIGEEVSLLAFCDGVRAVPMIPAQDHKRAFAGDRGPNTGGMGAYAPAPVCPADLVEELRVSVLQKVVDGCAAEGRPYVGVLYAGLMLTPDGPKVIEFNARFGDPEAQVLLPLLHSDLVEIALACANSNLDPDQVSWRAGAACAVVKAAPGYPTSSELGALIAVTGTDTPDSLLFHSGTMVRGGELVVGGGRVVSATGIGGDIAAARQRAYETAERVHFLGEQMRTDIGWRALARSTGGYAASGVDIDEGNRAVELLKKEVASTHGPAVLSGVGGFGGVFDVSALKHFERPVLVASTDGVGTKVALAAESGRLRGVGIDLVNHCVNDVLVQNARPLFFLDYVAAATINAEQVADIVSGMAEACAANGCALLGGETAEMPGVYHDGHVDVAGTLIGAADYKQLLPLPTVAPGDVLIGIASSGPHTNGYSLLRRMFAGLPLDAMPAPLEVPLGDALLEPHRSYLSVLSELLDGPSRHVVKALVHITGGGMQENLPRVLPPGVGAEVRLGSWVVPPLFQLVRDCSGLAADELHRTLNMGIGMVVVCDLRDAQTVQASINEPTWIIGELVKDPEGLAVLR
jgi:phosphoribosylamine--glycine ligase/phosphoribosylaminoimidazole synthetase